MPLPLMSIVKRVVGHKPCLLVNIEDGKFRYGFSCRLDDEARNVRDALHDLLVQLPSAFGEDVDFIISPSRTLRAPGNAPEWRDIPTPNFLAMCEFLSVFADVARADPHGPPAIVTVITRTEINEDDGYCRMDADYPLIYLLFLQDKPWASPTVGDHEDDTGDQDDQDDTGDQDDEDGQNPRKLPLRVSLATVHAFEREFISRFGTSIIDFHQGSAGSNLTFTVSSDRPREPCTSEVCEAIRQASLVPYKGIATDISEYDERASSLLHKAVAKHDLLVQEAKDSYAETISNAARTMSMCLSKASHSLMLDQMLLSVRFSDAWQEIVFSLAAQGYQEFLSKPVEQIGNTVPGKRRKTSKKTLKFKGCLKHVFAHGAVQDEQDGLPAALVMEACALVCIMPAANGEVRTEHDHINQWFQHDLPRCEGLPYTYDALSVTVDGTGERRVLSVVIHCIVPL